MKLLLIKVLSALVIIICKISRIQCQQNSDIFFVLDLPEGAECQFGTQNGTCMNARKCLSVHINLSLKEYPPICSIQGSDKIICCTDCKPINDTREVVYIANMGIFQRDAGRLADRKCLKFLEDLPYNCKDNYYTDLIHIFSWDKKRKCQILFTIQNQYEISGVDAERNEFPFMALLGYGDNIDSAEYLCGGSVISERFILTAAHCISSPILGPVKYIALGILKRSDPPSLWQRYTVDMIIPHPQYKSPSKYHDIALLKTNIKIIFSKTVQPACLNTKRHTLHKDLKDVYDSSGENYSRRGQAGYVTGWGRIGEKGEISDVLQKIYLTRYTDAECASLYQPFRHMLTGYDNVTQVCYGDKGGFADTCSGDSGGPVQFTVSSSIKECQASIYGVVSGGSPCGMKNGAGLYTRIDYYLDWIEDVVWK